MFLGARQVHALVGVRGCEASGDGGGERETDQDVGLHVVLVAAIVDRVAANSAAAISRAWSVTSPASLCDRCAASPSGAVVVEGIAAKRPLLVTDGVERVFEVGARGAPEVTAA
ncbi:MAG: hypothetical protein KIT31_35220 [Deltaproteobacteria bacterium]|nr:hypothetical protein [Deltaproteobacteria bacterium]